MDIKKTSRIIEEMYETAEDMCKCGVIDSHRLEEHKTSWLQRAQEAAAGGYLSADESDDFMKKRLARATEK